MLLTLAGSSHNMLDMPDASTSLASSWEPTSTAMHKQLDGGSYLRQRSIDVGSKTNVTTNVETLDNNGSRSDGWTENRESVNTGYWRSLAINFVAFSLPAIYLILSKLWIAQLDPSVVAVTDTFNYLGIIAEALNEGLPKAAWRTIANRRDWRTDERYGMANTLILVQSCLALILMVATCSGAARFAQGFVPAAIRAQSLSYIRLTSVSTACSMVNAGLSSSARGLDHPDIPLLLAVVKTVVNIILDLLLLSPFRPFQSHPTVNTQAIVRACCDLGATSISIVAFVIKQKRESRQEARWRAAKANVSVFALKSIGKVGVWYQIEALPRTAVSLWLLSLIISQGSRWATAYGVFFTIRIGFGFVPLLAIEASCQTYTGHAWGLVAGEGSTPDKMDRQEKVRRLKILYRSVAISTLLTCAIEILMYFGIGFGFGHQLAFYLSGSKSVADLTVSIWLMIDWGYIFLAMFFQVSSIILIAKPSWYFYQSLLITLVFALPMTIAFWRALNDEHTSTVWFVIASAGVYAVQFLNNLAWTYAYTRKFGR